MSGSGKLVNDPIHGYVHLEPEILSFIDTPQFQRLRELSQLGVVQYVFPGATHHRFEHSIGTAHIANKLLDKLWVVPEISSRDRMLVKIAALCHDLGHGPFSHAFDSEFLPRVGVSNWTHEEGSVMMFDEIVNGDGVAIDFEKRDRKFVHDLIHPPENLDFCTEGRPRFLYDIVSNSRNSIDVDKFDYLARDCHHIGMKQHYDYNRLLDNCKVIDDEICFHAKEVYNVYELFHTRFSLHKQVYTHRVVKAIEYMIIDAMIEANSVLKISEKIMDPEAYLQMTDAIVHKIEFSEDPRLEKSRKILQRLRRRDLYKMAAETVLPSLPNGDCPKIRPEDITSCYSANGLLSPEDIIVQTFRIDYSMKDRNPVDFVSFYNSSNPQAKFKISQEKVSLLIPQRFCENYIRVFCRDPTLAKMEAAEIALRRYLKHQQLSSPTPAFTSKRDLSLQTIHEFQAFNLNGEI